MDTPIKMIPIYKALADETRIAILEILSKGKLCACRIQDAFNCTQPTISYHMRVLTEAGLVKAERDGCLMCYELYPGVWDAICSFQSIANANAKGDV